MLQSKDLFKPRVGTIIICFKEDPSQYAKFAVKMREKGVRVVLKQSHPSDFDKLDPDLDKEHQNILIIDDPSHEFLNKPALSDYTTSCRHKKVSLFLIVHKIFSSSQTFRRMIASFPIFIFTVTRRALRDVGIIDSQNCLDGKLKKVFKYLVEGGNYRYLLLDLTATCPEQARLRVLRNGGGFIVFDTDE